MGRSASRNGVRAPSDATREALLEQLAHLAEEIDAFASQIDALPAEVFGTRPVEGDLSLKEIYALLPGYDRHVYLPVIEGLERKEPVELRGPGDASLLEEVNRHEVAMKDILEQARTARLELVERLRNVEDWNLGVVAAGETRSVYDLAYTIIRHDTELLRTAAVRIHDLGRLR